MKFKKKSIKGLLLIIIFVSLTKLTSSHIFIIRNMSSSLSGKYYLGVKTLNIRTNDIAVIQLKNDPYYKNARLMKIVSGIGGDSITKEGRSFYINGRYVGKAREYSDLGTKLEETKLAQDKIPKNHFFLTTNHENSYDSRYADIGFVSNDRVIGRAYKIF